MMTAGELRKLVTIRGDKGSKTVEIIQKGPISYIETCCDSVRRNHQVFGIGDFDRQWLQHSLRCLMPLADSFPFFTRCRLAAGLLGLIFKRTESQHDVHSDRFLGV